MKERIITDEIILAANSFIPIETKASLARTYARECLAEANISIGKDKDIDVLPPRYQESPMKKSIYGMMVLLGEYLNVLESDENGDYTLTSQEFNEWGKASIMNQLDRMKSSKNIEVRNKVYDILDDYREFYRMLGVEIAALVSNENDPLARFLQYFKSSVSADALRDAFSGLADAMKSIQEYQEKPKEWASKKATGNVTNG